MEAELGGGFGGGGNSGALGGGGGGSFSYFPPPEELDPVPYIEPLEIPEYNPPPAGPAETAMDVLFFDPVEEAARAAARFIDQRILAYIPDDPCPSIQFYSEQFGGIPTGNCGG